MKKILAFATLIFLNHTILNHTLAQNIVASGEKPVKISSDYRFTEGPAADAEGNVYFTDQPNNHILKWSVNGEISVFMENCGRSNGLYFDNNGKLLACADENNELWSINTKTKEHKVILEDFEGKKINAPNDLWVAPNGGIYFTDPFYKREYWSNQNRKAIKENVYYISPDRKTVRVVEDEVVKPNGIIGTPNGKTLYVADIGDSKTYSYTINEDGSLTDKKFFCEMGSDGMTLDEQGNVYLTGKGVTVFNPKGEKILNIPINQDWTANVTFGGKDNDLLFITAMNSVYTLKMNVKGTR